MKKFLRGFIAIVMMMALLPVYSLPVYAEAPDVTMTSEPSVTSNIEAGSSTTVTVVVSSPNGIEGTQTFGFDVGFDKTKWTVTSITYNENLNRMDLSKNIVGDAQKNGQVVATFYTGNNGEALVIDKGTTFVTATFTATAGAAVGKADFTLENINAGDVAKNTDISNTINVLTTSASYNIVSTVTTAPTFGLNTPVKGAPIASDTGSVPTGSNYSIQGVKWYKASETTPTTDTVFAASTAYTAEVTLVPANYYSFQAGIGAATSNTDGTLTQVSSAADKIVAKLAFNPTASQTLTGLTASPASVTTEYYDGETFSDPVTLTAHYDTAPLTKDVTTSVTMPVMHKGDTNATFTYVEGGVTETATVTVPAVKGKNPASLFTAKNQNEVYSGSSFAADASDTAYGYNGAAGTATYTFTPSDPLNIGTYNVIASVPGNDTYAAMSNIAVGTITISANAVSSAVYSGTAVYNGAAQTMDATKLVVKDSKGNTLKAGTDYDAAVNSGNAMINAGSYTIAVTGKGGYAGSSVNATLTISPKVIDPATDLNWASLTKSYDGSDTAAPAITVNASAMAGSDDAKALTVAYTKAAYASAYVSSNDAITATGVTLTGLNGNYALKGNATTLTNAGGSITAADQDLSKASFTGKNLLAGGDGVKLAGQVSGINTKVELSFRLGATVNPAGCVTLANDADGNAVITGVTAGGNATVQVSGTGYDVNGDGTNEYNGFGYTAINEATFTVTDRPLHTFAAGFDTAATVTYGDNGNTYTRVASLTDDPAGTPVKAITYASSDTTVATVDATGKVTVLKASETPVTITASVEGNNLYSDASISYELTINKKPVTVTAGTFKVSKAYDDTAKAEGFSSGKLSIEGLLSGDESKVTATPVVVDYIDDLLGTRNQSLSFTFSDSTGNYTAANTTVSVPYEITKATLTRIGSGVATTVYGNTLALVPITGLTVKLGDKIVEGKWLFEDKSVPDAGTVVRTARFVPTFGTSEFNQLYADVTVTVEKADAPVLADLPVNQKWSIASGVKESVGSAMPSDAGNLTYAKGTETAGTNTAVASWDVDANGKVSYTLTMTKDSVGDTVKLPVTISSKNYKDTTVTVVITITDKDVPVITLNKITKTYNGLPVTADMANPAAKFGNASVEGTWAFKNATAEQLTNANAETSTDAGINLTVVFTPTDTANYAPVEKDVAVVIVKSEPSNLPKSSIYSAKGMTLANAKATLESTLQPAGTVVFYDENGKQIPDANLANYEVTANTSYTFTYTPLAASSTNYKATTYSLVLWNVPKTSGEKDRSFLITFLDCKGNTVKVQWVKYGADAEAPAGYVYSGYTNVTANRDLRPVNCSVGGYLIPNTADKSN